VHIYHLIFSTDIEMKKEKRQAKKKNRKKRKTKSERERERERVICRLRAGVCTLFTELFTYSHKNSLSTSLNTYTFFNISN
jgi:hypothetical protein